MKFNIFMDTKIFLEKNQSKFSNNVEGAINLALSTKTRLLPNDGIINNFSLFKQYNKEKDDCTKYRFILNINPICSNVLFNPRTEIVINEGSSSCTLLIGDKKIDKKEYAPNAVNTTKKIDYMTAIRNTEYSHKENGQFIYHCGYDIFNNHMLRKKEFIHVNKLGSSSIKGENYNTIFDYSRDGRGDIIEEEIFIKSNNRGEKVKMHLYQSDTIMSMTSAFLDNCIEKNGWWGFINPNTIETSTEDKNIINVNRMMANNKSCEFIDLYPDRSLFSFIPKYNKYRKRIEKNWDYCLTYPYKVDYDLVNTVCGGKEQSIRANIKLVKNSSSIDMIECSSYFKHNLKVGNYVTFFYYRPHYKTFEDTNEELVYYVKNGVEYFYKKSDFDDYGNLKEDNNGPVKEIVNKTFSKHSIKIKVEKLGDINNDNKDKIFVVKYSDIEEIYENMNYFGCFYKKNSANSDCLYYFRKFKKLKSINGEDIKSDINKVAFANNIYGDELAQVIFTDDINVENLLDHNGRPISELYFTTIKRNAGRKEWYENKNYSSSMVEFSHCFGEVTSGIDFSGIENEPFDYNVHYLHNLSASTKASISTPRMFTTLSAWGETILNGMPKTIEKDITIGNDEFYGDIVEYDIYEATETVIGNVYHRFNTAQRECWNNDFQHIKHDEIVMDDYDAANGYGVTSKSGFTIETYYLNNVKNALDKTGSNDKNLIYGNISPEGYFYNPHTKISINEYNSEKKSASAKHINYEDPFLSVKNNFILFKADGSMELYDSIEKINNAKSEGDEIGLQNYYYELEFLTPVSYKIYKGDHIAFYDNKTTSLLWGEVDKYVDSKLTVKIAPNSLESFGDITNNDFDPYSGSRRFYAFISENNVPICAKLCEPARMFVWRDLIKPSNLPKDSELYNMPFTNGCFYVEKNINFFLRRQDPIGKYGLLSPMYKTYRKTVSNPLVKFNIRGKSPIDFSDILFTSNNFGNTCY